MNQLELISSIATDLHFLLILSIIHLAINLIDMVRRFLMPKKW